MALKLLQSGLSPLGQYDGLDSLTDLSTGMLGGEVCTLAAADVAGADLGAADADDGYINGGGLGGEDRPVASFALAAGSPFYFLGDEGASGYGTLFGQLVGSVAGQVVTGSQLGPHTSSGSGKVTLWQAPGLYGITLDAVISGVTGLQPTNPTVTTGSELYVGANGKLTPIPSASGDVVARFVEFATNGSLVTTPGYLTNSATSDADSASMAVVYFNPEV
jgi:hypothetical protein